jgi:hypothetical protein
MLDFNQNFAAWSKAMAAPFAELHNVNSRIAEQLARDCVEMASSSMANGIKHLQSSLKMRDAEDFMKLQMDYMTDMSSKCLGFGKEFCKNFEGIIRDYRKWAEDHTTNVMSHDCCKKTNKTS